MGLGDPVTADPVPGDPARAGCLTGHAVVPAGDFWQITADMADTAELARQAAP